MTGIKIQQLIKPTSWWASHDIVLADREFGYEIAGTNVRRKTGDGVKKWSEITTYDKLTADDVDFSGSVGMGDIAVNSLSSDGTVDAKYMRKGGIDLVSTAEQAAALAGKADKTTTINGHNLSVNGTIMASEVPITDPDNLYDANNAEDALKEISHKVRNRYAPRLGAIVSDDNAVNIQDAATNAEFSSLLAKGKTTETGTGTKSPDNPYALTGVTPTKLKTCKKNIFNPAVGSVTVNGVTITVEADGTITLDSTATATTYIHVFPLFNANPANGTVARRLALGKKYVLSCTAISGTVSGVATFYFLDEAGINYPTNDLAYVQVTGNTSATLTAGTAFSTGFSTSLSVRDGYIQILSGAVFSAYKFRLQFEQAATATAWEAYSGADYAIAPVASLYRLPDGTADTYDAVSGLETHNVGVSIADGNISPLVSATNTNTVVFACPVTPGRFDTGFISPRFPWTADSSDTEHSRIGGPGGAFIYFYINKTRLSGYSDSWTDAQKVAAFKTWLASHNITTLYGLVTPTTTQHTVNNIPQPSPIANIWADAGGVSADYTKDLAIQQTNALTLKANAAQEDWITPTFQNSWVNYSDSFSSAGYYKDTIGVVHLKGYVKSGTINTTIFTLPAAYTPSKTLYFAVPSNNAFGLVMIGSGGSVVCQFGNNSSVCLDSIVFRI